MFTGENVLVYTFLWKTLGGPVPVHVARSPCSCHLRFLRFLCFLLFKSLKQREPVRTGRERLFPLVSRGISRGKQSRWLRAASALRALQ